MKRFALLFMLMFATCFATLNAAPLKIDKAQLEPKRGAKVELQGNAITLRLNDPEWSGGVVINPPPGRSFWDFSSGQFLKVDVENLSKDRQMRLTMHLHSGSREEKNNREINTGIGLNPGEKRTMSLFLPHPDIYTKPTGIRGHRQLNTSQVSKITFELQWPFEAVTPDLVYCRLSNFRLEGMPNKQDKIAEDKFFPFIDVYGQYKHSNWPEKIKSDNQLKENHRRELAELDRLSMPAEWNKYGGWQNGPQLEATGSFRTEKYQGKWFLVDPEGKLFYSTGIDVLRNQTDATSARNPQWFEKPEMAENGSMPFTHWNLQKKYGKKDYLDDFYHVMVRRLNAWGMNTIGCWGSSDVMLLGEKPYTLQLVEFNKNRWPHLKGEGVNLKFYDMFDPEFETRMSNLLADRAKEDPLVAKSIDDPMCIGYFIDNELQFNRIIGEMIKSNPDQPMKKAFVDGLQQKYDTIEKLNAAWKTSFADWDAVLANTKAAEGDEYRKDTREFHARAVDRYFEMCRAGIKNTAPHRLYLGTRFVGFRQSPYVMEAAAKHNDVISINTYTNSVANVPVKDMRDKPVLIGEFHFGILDRGMFSASLVPAGATQADRAAAYTRFMQGALVHPNIVGAHWFQFRDQPLTGRWDGEGYQIGFVDVADTPYPELCKAAREVGENMYQYRLRGKYVNSMK